MRQSLQTLKGVGEKTEKLFFRLGIYDTEDLLHYYPRNYDAFEAPVDIADLEEGTVKAVSAAVCSGVYVRSAGGKQIITATVTDQSGKLSVIWFNMPYLRTILKKGSTFVLRGRVIKKQNRIQMEHPEVFTPAAYEEILHSLQPIYGLTSGLSNKTITKTIRQLLENLPMYSEFLSEDIRQRYQLADINYALRTIHFPLSMEELLVSRKRLVFDEFLLFILSIQMMKEKNEETPNYFPIQKTWVTEQIIENLPYSLTNAQLNTWHEIERDMSGQALMSRLIQGDVGSGKTIIAFLAMILSCENGYQSALMVPTEVLARQHYESFMELLAQQGLDFCTVLLTGSNTAKEKREIYVEGEVFLEVAENVDRPFYVRTQEFEVRVLGTSFGIRAYEDEMEQGVVLVSGKVNVKTKDRQETVLTPNDRYVLQNGKPVVKLVDVYEYISWKDGVLCFERSCIGDILTRLEKYYGVEIDYTSEVKGISCSGKLELKNDLKEVLESLTKTAPIRYESVDNKIKVMKKEKESMK